MQKIFLRYTIKGDKLDIDDISRNVNIPADLYRKNEIVEHRFVKNPKPQKTNRWVYSLESENGQNINKLIKTAYNVLAPYSSELSKYALSNSALLEIVVYVEKNSSVFNLKLSKKSIDIIDALHSKLSITFVDF